MTYHSIRIVGRDNTLAPAEASRFDARRHGKTGPIRPMPGDADWLPEVLRYLARWSVPVAGFALLLWAVWTGAPR